MTYARKGWSRRAKFVFIAAAALVAVGLTMFLTPRMKQDGTVQPQAGPQGEVEPALRQMFDERARAILKDSKGPVAIERLYDGGGDSPNKALQHELLRIRYIRDWASKRRVRFTDSATHLEIRDLRVDGDMAYVNLWQSLNLKYVHESLNARRTDLFGIRTRHVMELVRREGRWLIRRDDYTDPLGEDTLVPEVAPAAGEELRVVEARSTAQAKGQGRAPSYQGRAPSYDRSGARDYANKYCGVWIGDGKRFGYNPRYRDCTDLGGDCTNFISQVLGDREGGRLAMDDTWYYDYREGAGSKAWAETGAFSDYILQNGIVRLVARGTYQEVAHPSRTFPRGAIKDLMAGDLVAYEEKGKIQHFAVVVGKDSVGYPVVNSHTADRYRVPWDLGWDRKTVFWLLKVVR